LNYVEPDAESFKIYNSTFKINQLRNGLPLVNMN